MQILHYKIQQRLWISDTNVLSVFKMYQENANMVILSFVFLAKKTNFKYTKIIHFQHLTLQIGSFEYFYHKLDN